LKTIELPYDAQAYDAVIFDCDGTLVDTMPAHYRAWSRTMAEYGIEFPEARFYALGGVPAPTIVSLLAEEAGRVLDADRVAEEKERRFTEGLESVEPIEPVLAYARSLRGRKPIAVATGAQRWVAYHALDLLGIRDWFDAIVTFEDVARPKPAPDTYLEAARVLGVEPARCLALEDAAPGIASARAAGMAVVEVK